MDTFFFIGDETETQGLTDTRQMLSLSHLPGPELFRQGPIIPVIVHSFIHQLYMRHGT